MSQWVKNPPTIQETQETPVRFLGQADPLEKSMTTHSNILAWRIQWTEEPGGLLSMGHMELDMTEVTEHANMHSMNILFMLGRYSKI